MSRSPYPQSDRELLNRISRSAGGKAGYKQLIRELGLGGGRERRLLLEQLTRMVARGDLKRLEEELWAVPKPPAEVSHPSRASRSSTRPNPIPDVATPLRQGRDRLQSGRLELHRDGFGFVRPDPKTTTPGSDARQDIFIPPNALNGAMHSDIVLVDEDAPARDGRRSGRVARVLTRRNPTIVGIFHYALKKGYKRNTRAFTDQATISEHASNWVQPWDERLGGPVEIADGDEVVGTDASPHRMLGEEAARARAGGARRKEADAQPRVGEPGQEWDRSGSLEGLAVEVEVTSFPQQGRPARGRVIEVLGPPDAFGVDVEIIIRKHGIPHTFPAHVLAEAEERAQESVASLSAAELTLREDFRGLPIVTIDGETARDFDDAVLVRQLENGHSELQVHIADVSWYVQPGSALDTEARVRGTSVYFPDRAVPMLPHSLSSNMCSLRPDEDRLVQSCVMQIDPRGEIVSYRVTEGIMRSARRMTYTSVQHCLNASPAASGWNTHATVTPEPSAEDQLERERIALERPELPAAFDRMLELALQLNRKRVRRGSIDFDLPEPVVQFDPDGNMKAIVRSERGWAHRLIEEFMLSANECVATWLTAQEIPSIYRIHEMPDPKRIVEFEETAASFGQTLGIGALPVKRLTMKSDRRESQRRSARGKDNRPAQAHEIPERIPVTPQMYQKLVRKIHGKPEERILAYLMLRSLKQARYAAENEGHFALASPCYTHFTSPIRRYPDLIVHRLLGAMLRRGAKPVGGAILSDDPQPWKTDLERTQGRHAVDARSLAGTKTKAAVPEHAVEPERTSKLVQTRLDTNRAKRVGRVGWTEEGAVQRTGPMVATDRAEEFESVNEGRSPEQQLHTVGEPIPAEELTDIAVESSQAERRASDAERELIEWKKMKFMADKVGDDFKGIILSITKFGFFVELDELFIEGLVPIGSLVGDHYTFRDADRVICGARTEHCFRIGDHVEVILDRIDRQQRRLQFALLPGTEPQGGQGAGKRDKGESKKTRTKAKKQAKREAKPKEHKRRK